MDNIDSLQTNNVHRTYTYYIVYAQGGKLNSRNIMASSRDAAINRMVSSGVSRSRIKRAIKLG